MSKKLNSILAAAVAALVIVGCGGGGETAEEDPVLARVGDEVIRRSALERLIAQTPAHLRSMHDNPQMRELLLNQLIQQKLMYLAAKDQGLDRLPEVKTQLEQAVEQVLQTAFYNRNFPTDEPISESEIETFYKNSKEDYLGEEQVRLQHIEVADKGTADKLLNRLRSGADFGQLAREYSLDKFSKDSGGDLGYIQRNRSIPGIGGASRVRDLVEVAFDAKAGEIAGPIKIDNHYHIIRVIEAAHRQSTPLDQVKANISRKLVQQHRVEKEKTLFDELERKYPVQKFTRVLNPDPTKTARELFEEAQTTADPKERLLAYERIIEFYPNSADAEKAMFMTGYTYANDLQEYKEAERVFRNLLEKFPEGEYADDTRWMLKNMRLPEKKLEEMVRP